LKSILFCYKMVLSKRKMGKIEARKECDKK
jgi:hypothetical protein